MLASEVTEICLHPGECLFVRTPTVIKTVLGSCVGITFRVHRLGIGAMCHPMLPHIAARPIHTGTAGTGRYVDAVVRDLASRFDEAGACRNEVEVKLFGGADVLVTAREKATVGAMNVDTAMRILEDEGFRILASRVGGRHGVFVEFHTWTGEVFLRHLSHMDADALART